MPRLGKGGAVLTVPSEHYEQVRFVGKFRVKYPGVRIFAIPNGGHRGKVTALKMKSEGVSLGVPDLYIPAWRLWIEMKRVRGGSVSPDQRDWHEYLEGIGDDVMVCRGSDEALDKVEEYRKQHLYNPQ